MLSDINGHFEKLMNTDGFVLHVNDMNMILWTHCSFTGVQIAKHLILSKPTKKKKKHLKKGVVAGKCLSDMLERESLWSTKKSLVWMKKPFLLAHLSQRANVIDICPSSVVHPLSVIRQHLPCEHDRGHTFDLNLMKLGQIVNWLKISDGFEIGSCGV